MIDPTVSAHYVGDCRELLHQLPDGCVQTIVTSTPYWGLRSYFGDGDPRRTREIGNEPSPKKFVENLVAVFSEARRVLRDDGTMWLNLGDTYVANPRGPNGASSSTLTGTPDSERRRKRWQAAGGTDDPKFDKERQRAVRACGLKIKDLVGIPWRVALALQDDGWWLRDDIIWHKPNPMPSPIEDRTTKAHEYVFLLTKSASYFYDAAAIAEPAVEAGRIVPLGAKSFNKRQLKGQGEDRPNYHGDEYLVPPTRNARSVWTIATQPYDGAHFATMPPRLAERCILAGSRPSDVVLDPFFGSGTTGAVAEKHGRRWIGFDLGYEQLAKERTAQRSLPIGGTR